MRVMVGECGETFFVLRSREGRRIVGENWGIIAGRVFCVVGVSL